MASKPKAQTRVITAHVPIALAKKIDKLAAQMERPRGWIVKQALANWADAEEWRHEQTLVALAEIDAGKGISHEEMVKWAKTLGKKERAVK
ncbi:MAG: CopG family ribbon-helix-helix protein [Rickettsiales bacterium]